MKFGKRLKLEAGALGITHAVLDYWRMKKVHDTHIYFTVQHVHSNV